jgi:hypothetical protein
MAPIAIEVLAGLKTANELFPLVASLVQQIESLFPHAPGKDKLNAVINSVQTTLQTANADATSIAAVAPIVTNMASSVKALYNANKVVVASDPLSGGVPSTLQTQAA